MFVQFNSGKTLSALSYLVPSKCREFSFAASEDGLTLTVVDDRSGKYAKVEIKEFSGYDSQGYATVKNLEVGTVTVDKQGEYSAFLCLFSLQNLRLDTIGKVVQSAVFGNKDAED